MFSFGRKVNAEVAGAAVVRGETADAAASGKEGWSALQLLESVPHDFVGVDKLDRDWHPSAADHDVLPDE